MVRLLLTLTSGMQVEWPTTLEHATEVAETVTAAWQRPDRASPHLLLTSAGGLVDWVRTAHVSAVRIAPDFEDEEGGDGPAVG